MDSVQTTQIRIERYRQLRATGKVLVEKMYEVARGPLYDLHKAARKLTIPVVDRTFILDGETDTTALADFYLHEMRYGGRRIVDVLAESGAELTSDERFLLEAHRKARCSLFEILGLEPDARQIRIRDLLTPDSGEVSFMDINMSTGGAIEPGDMLFMRLIDCGELVMGCGLFFGFRAVHRVHLLNAYAERMRTVHEKDRAERSYVFFYRKHREIGVEQAYEDVA